MRDSKFDQSPPGTPIVPRAEWDRPPWNRWSFQHVREILPTVEIWRGRGPVRELPRDEQPLDGLTVAGVDGRQTTLAAFLDQTFTDGFLVLRRRRHRLRALPQRHGRAHAAPLAVGGEVVHRDARRHPRGARRDRRHGAGDRPTCPSWQSTAYRGATVQHLLDMTSGVRFNEDYTDPFSDMGRSDVAAGWKPIPADAEPGLHWPQSIFEFVLTLRDARPRARQRVRLPLDRDRRARLCPRARDRQAAGPAPLRGALAKARHGGERQHDRRRGRLRARRRRPQRVPPRLRPVRPDDPRQRRRDRARELDRGNAVGQSRAVRRAPTRRCCPTAPITTSSGSRTAQAATSWRAASSASSSTSTSTGRWWW